jgi:hypothetical protein
MWYDAPRWATAVSFVDYDRDGWSILSWTHVDLPPSEQCYDVRTCSISADSPTPGRPRGCSAIWRRDGPPAFEDTTVRSGARSPLGVSCADFDGIAGRTFSPMTADRIACSESAQRNVPRRGGGARSGLRWFGAMVATWSGQRRCEWRRPFDVSSRTSTASNMAFDAGTARCFHPEQVGARPASASARYRFGAVLADSLTTAAGPRARQRRNRTPAQSGCGAGSRRFGRLTLSVRSSLLVKAPDVRAMSQRQIRFCSTGQVGRGLAALDFDDDGALIRRDIGRRRGALSQCGRQTRALAHGARN